MQRDIDVISERLTAKYPTLKIEQWKVIRPSDDDGIWYFTHPNCEFEVSLENSSGKCPFLFETDENDERQTVLTVEEAIRVIEKGLGQTTNQKLRKTV